MASPFLCVVPSWADHRLVSERSTRNRDRSLRHQLHCSSSVSPESCASPGTLTEIEPRKPDCDKHRVCIPFWLNSSTLVDLHTATSDHPTVAAGQLGTEYRTAHAWLQSRSTDFLSADTEIMSCIWRAQAPRPIVLESWKGLPDKCIVLLQLLGMYHC